MRSFVDSKRTSGGPCKGLSIIGKGWKQREKRREREGGGGGGVGGEFIYNNEISLHDAW